MTLHHLLRQISKILTPKTDSLYDYMLHTFDDNGGFLRTRYCYWDEVLKDHNIHDLKQVLICFREPFSDGDVYYDIETVSNDEETWIERYTRVKMQLFYDEDIEFCRDWNKQFDFRFEYLIDLNTKSVHRLS